MELTRKLHPYTTYTFRNITAKELSIIGLIGSDKVYDDTTMASASGTATLSGDVRDDVFLGGRFTFG